MIDYRIVIDPAVHFGQPCIAGTRIPVYCVLELVQAGVPFDEIVTRYYPDLTVEDVKACVQYATDLVKGEETHLAEMKVPGDFWLTRMSISPALTSYALWVMRFSVMEMLVWRGRQTKSYFDVLERKNASWSNYGIASLSLSQVGIEFGSLPQEHLEEYE